MDQLILPLYVSPAELAIYSVATSIVVLATFAMSPISQSLAPRVADLTRRGELRRLAIAYKAAASWMTRFAAVLRHHLHLPGRCSPCSARGTAWVRRSP